MPSVSMGIMADPVTALLAASGGQHAFNHAFAELFRRLGGPLFLCVGQEAAGASADDDYVVMHGLPRFAYAEKEGRNFLERSARPAAVRVP